MNDDGLCALTLSALEDPLVVASVIVTRVAHLPVRGSVLRPGPMRSCLTERLPAVPNAIGYVRPCMQQRCGACLPHVGGKRQGGSASLRRVTRVRSTIS